ncbi:hypothetical protein TBLA_0A05560 [Henningerozyma blattae CBS 6284]|uniref:J domain-containing protein n=1 Tax=Henningerozyma blattae (strain ATCC 34711 / CBS 6284 / DSM 70876 / NBRC 10599 / NRRL Y-10934 / UCD 77-7) TaxID=1071380 RepID=I2GW47_HENB6|nr:hypothetical protein TBLA_0A05560 [Tetrapisispora blattae CBS 6284]CCH58349.1 hypothetical protein TBLA_0A05560 [Tetrapisispora blattae CBS 6284]
MSKELQQIIENKVNLYDILGFHNNNSTITSNEIKKRYRSLALKYHPDKTPNDLTLVEKFHKITIALNILTNNQLKTEYDKWLNSYLLIQRRNDDVSSERKILMEKLTTQEVTEKQKNLINRNDNYSRDLGKIQEYGESLRKLKQFKMPYGDWRNLNRVSKPNIKPEWKDVALNNDVNTLRIEVENLPHSELGHLGLDLQISKKDQLQSYLENSLGLQFEELYYSSRNNFQNDDTIVAYAVFQKTADSKKVFQLWESNSIQSPLIVNISPLIPVSFYHNIKIPKDSDKLNRSILDQLSKTTFSSSTTIHILDD